MRNFDKFLAEFSPKYCSAFAEKAMKPLGFMHYAAMSMFLGSKNFLNLIHFWVFQRFPMSDIPHHIPVEVPPG